MIQVQSSRRMKIKMNIVLALLVLVGFGVLIGRLYQLQLVPPLVRRRQNCKSSFCARGTPRPGGNCMARTVESPGKRKEELRHG